MENITNEKSYIGKAALVLVIILSVYFVVKTLGELKKTSLLGESSEPATITFDGTGEVTATPDLATISFTIRDTQKELKNAQDKVTAKESAVLKFLDTQNIDEKDIKTESYSSYPKYDYGTPCYSGMMVPCRQDAPTIIGYEVSEYISVKIRDITKAGEIIKGIGAVGVSEMNGPNFSIENEDALKAEARKEAIEDARAKAEVLARDLGVKLVRIVSFSENGNYPMPMYYTKDMMANESSAGAPAPELPTGENKITSYVNITYEIR